MSILLSSVLNGLSFAALLFLIAGGFTLLYGIMRLLNLAHGALYLWGAYLAAAVISGTGNYLLAVLVAGGVVGIATVIGGVGLFARVQGNELREVLLTIAVSLVLADAALAVWGGHPVGVQAPEFLRGAADFMPVAFPIYRLFLMGLALAVGFGLWYLIERTSVGALLRACVDNRAMLASLGVNVRRLYWFVWMAGGFLAGVAGLLGSIVFGIAPGVDVQILLLALVVVVLGGLGSLSGAALGSLVVGLSYSFATVYAPELLYFIIFGPMLILLVIRPQGLRGANA
ncbi:branched-chain amino acid ABC transporter permease [Phytoactinopolyspora limicola]|uniref:branched-chain amino acid ABC transporter permease n=1 Tax=Phytoactinopolyspora limicola TaxID=2715536 RepID=UPI0014084260|nr:branched-chain amino acid ABC transporter permease [Phytoactinopolyspora limicola]